MLAWTQPTQLGDDFYFDFRNKSTASVAPLQAAQLTIQYIVQNYPAPYTLYLSGGVDSQAMLYAWHQSGVPYQTFSAVYNQNLNSHDLCDIEKFSKDLGVEVDYHDFDLIDFLETQHEHYANTYRCGSPQITTFMRLADLTDAGTVIMSGNFILKPGFGTGIPDRNNFSLYYYGLTSGRNIVPFFFLETCELAHAFDTEIPEISAEHTAGSYTDKVAAYSYYGFPVIAQATKLNGFERLKELYDTNPPRMPTVAERISRLPWQASDRNFDMLYRNKYEAKFFKYKYVTKC